MRAAGEGGDKRRISSVLFVCGMNAIRSPMAEALARSLLPQSVYVASAGVRDGQRDPFVDSVLAEKGLSLGDRRPQRLEDLEDSYFDLIVTMAPEAHHAVLDATGTASVDVEFWPMPDPSVATGSREQILEAYRAVCSRIDDHIRKRLLQDQAPPAAPKD
jgi:protein-tyrosine-phosphatase